MTAESLMRRMGAFFGAFSGRVAALITGPGAFFTQYPEERPSLKPLGLMLASATFYAAAAAALHAGPKPQLTAGIFFVNAVGMPLIAAVVGYALMRIIAGPNLDFVRFAGIYAYAASVVLLIAWVPLLLWFAEIWRWWMIGKGLRYGCALALWQTLAIIVLSISGIVLGFQSFIV